MDDSVLRSMAKWPDVADVYDWLALDRRGNWRLRTGTDAAARFERIGNLALREFIARNYQPDARGRWYFQNGPQRVFVRLAYTPLIVRMEADALVDHCDRPFVAEGAYADDEGSVLLCGRPGVALLDDRDLGRYADQAAGLAEIPRTAVPARFGFVPNPAP